MKYGTRIQGHSSLRIRVARALPQNMRGPVLELTELRTHPDHRGKGEASALLLATTLEADLAHKFLMLMPEPTDDSPLDTEALAAFYAKFKFGIIQMNPMLMVRPPVGAFGAIQ